MKVCIYKGGLKLVKKSGVGQAVFHQEEILGTVGIETTSHLKKDAGIVQINTIFPDSFIIALLAGKLGKKVIYYGHSTMEDFRNSFKGSNLLAGLFKKWIKICYSTGDLIITPTEYSKNLLETYGIQKPICALSNGVDTGFFLKNSDSRERFRRKYHLGENEKAVMSVGHYIERKGILEFIRLAKNFPEIRFFWFGYTNLNLVPGKIKQAILSAPENVEFPGYVDRTELRDAYCGCDLFAFLSYEETEGIVVLEALAAKIPVLLRDIPVYDGWLEDGVNVYKASDEEGFTKHINDIFLYDNLPDLTEKGRKTAEERSFAKIGKMMTEIYQRLG